MEPGVALHRERDATRAVSGTSPTRLPTSRTPSTSSSSRAAAMRSILPGSGPRRRRTTPSTCRPAEAGPSACVSRPPGRTRPSAISRTIVKSRIADADEFYARITPHALSEDERRVHRQALAGMLWGKQFYYFDLERWLQRAQEPSAARGAPARHAQQGMVSHAERRCDLHAGQVGVSVVRGLGSGVPHHRAVAGGFRVRQGAAPADAAEYICPPQRANARVRVELRRCESRRCTRGRRSTLQVERTLGRADRPSWNDRFTG